MRKLAAITFSAMAAAERKAVHWPIALFGLLVINAVLATTLLQDADGLLSVVTEWRQ